MENRFELLKICGVIANETEENEVVNIEVPEAPHEEHEPTNETTNMPNIGDLNISHHDVELILLPKSSTGYNSTIARALHFVSNNKVSHNMILKVYQV